ncbi:MAG: hypothetical protein KJO07_06825, partial [Deltaproteobacteria bacterium]|nr:hypothetical protein [Deltaproteobacteria bacterium]
ALAMLGAAPASAQSVSAAQTPADYTASMMWTDGASMAAVALGLAIGVPNSQPGTRREVARGMIYAGTATWVVGSLAHHVGRGELDRAALSVSLRVGLPLALAYGSRSLASELRCLGECGVNERDDAEIVGIGAGFLVGGALATALDHFWLSKYEGVTLSPSVTPALVEGQPGMVAGLGGTF